MRYVHISLSTTRSGRLFRFGCPISSLPKNRLRQLSTPAHAYALLHLPPAALPSLPEISPTGSIPCGIKK